MRSDDTPKRSTMNRPFSRSRSESWASFASAACSHLGVHQVQLLQQDVVRRPPSHGRPPLCVDPRQGEVCGQRRRQVVECGLADQVDRRVGGVPIRLVLEGDQDRLPDRRHLGEDVGRDLELHLEDQLVEAFTDRVCVGGGVEPRVLGALPGHEECAEEVQADDDRQP